MISKIPVTKLRYRECRVTLGLASNAGDIQVKKVSKSINLPSVTVVTKCNVDSIMKIIIVIEYWFLR